MAIDLSNRSTSDVIASRLVVASLALALSLPGSAAYGSGSHGRGPGSPPSHGPLLPLLPDGTPIEPSTYREETTESVETLDGGRWDWGVDLVGGSMDQVDRLRASSLEWVHFEARRGLGRGLEIGARAESWNQGMVQQGALKQSAQASGLGPTTLTLRQHLIGADASRPSAAAGLRIRLPGSLDGPGTSAMEGGVFFPVAFPLGESARMGMMLEGDVVPDAFDSGRHAEGVSSMELSRDLTDHFSGRIEAVGVWYGENGRPWLGVMDAGLSVDPAPHVGVTLGASGGVSGGTTELGWFGRLSVHP